MTAGDMGRIRFWMDIHNVLGDEGLYVKRGIYIPLFRWDSMARLDEGCTYAALEIQVMI